MCKVRLIKLISVSIVFLLLNQNIFAASHVIHISVDGLYSKAITILSESEIPHITRLIHEGASTLEARTDTEETTTLPNHTSQFSGRRVNRNKGGHGWRLNFDPGTATLHSNAGEYIASIFDGVHDAGFSTSLFAGKSKFSLFKRSWNALNGDHDRNGADNGKNKIDVYKFDPSTPSLVSEFISDLSNQTRHYAFLHIRDPDTAGHEFGWSISPGSEYLNAIKTTDSYIGQILNFISTNREYSNSTVVILTSDHGGVVGTDNHPSGNHQSQTIPFIIWGQDVEISNIYFLNKLTAIQPPATENPPFDKTLQPIRNGDAANLASMLLGLPPIPGSHIHTIKQLKEAE